MTNLWFSTYVKGLEKRIEKLEKANMVYSVKFTKAIDKLKEVIRNLENVNMS